MLLSIFWPRPAADAAAFEREALPHLDSLYRTARRLCANDADAEDLVQEAFERAWKYFHKFQPGTNCRAWLMRILQNAYNNSWRKKARAPASVPLDATEDHLFYQHLQGGERMIPTPEDQVLAAAWDRDVLESIDRLPEDYRVAVVLCDVEEFSYKEIADILDVPIGTVRSRIFRGRHLLQKMLVDRHGGGPAPAAAREATGEA